MDTEKYKSIAISMPVYLKLRQLAQNKFDAPVSMAKIVEMEINKSFEKTFAEEISLAIEQQDRHLQTALQELEKVSHPGNYQSWITKHKSMLEKTKAANPIAYGKFKERFTELKSNLETKGVLNG